MTGVRFSLGLLNYMPKWRNGRRDGLKNHYSRECASSSLAFGTKTNKLKWRNGRRAWFRPMCPKDMQVQVLSSALFMFLYAVLPQLEHAQVYWAPVVILVHVEMLWVLILVWEQWVHQMILRATHMPNVEDVCP